MTAYATLAEVKEALSVGMSSAMASRDDDLITRLLEETSREIDNYCNRWFYPVTQTRYYDAYGDHVSGDCLSLLLDADLADLTSVTIANGDTVVPLVSVKIYPLNHYPKFELRLASTSGYSWNGLSGDWEGSIAIEGVWGFLDRLSDPMSTDPPSVIKHACIDAVVYSYKNAPLGGGGQPGVAPMQPRTIKASLPDAVTQRLDRYRKPIVAGV